jgi:hypothetical protein
MFHLFRLVSDANNDHLSPSTMFADVLSVPFSGPRVFCKESSYILLHGKTTEGTQP